MMRFLRRPLAGLHWTVLVFLLLSWAYVAFGRPCSRGPFYLEAFVLALTVLFALCSGVRLAKKQTRWKKVGYAILSGIWDVFVLALLGAAVTAFFIPAYQCYSPKVTLETGSSYPALERR